MFLGSNATASARRLAALRTLQRTRPISRGRKRLRSGSVDTTGERDHSPLFEPEGEPASNPDMDDRETTIAQESPAARHPPSVPLVKVGKKLCVRYKPREQSASSDDAQHSEVQRALSKPPTPTLADDKVEALKHVSTISPLQGNTNNLPEYVQLIEELSAASKQQVEKQDAIRDHDDQFHSLTFSRSTLDQERKATLESIAQVCAQGIKGDMSTVASDMDAIKRAIDKRHAEAGAARGNATRASERLKVDLEEEIRDLSRAREMHRANKRVVDGQIKKLEDRKAELEKDGGLALAFALGVLVGKSSDQREVGDD